MVTGLFLQDGPTLMEETAASRALETAVDSFLISWWEWRSSSPNTHTGESESGEWGRLFDNSAKPPGVHLESQAPWEREYFYNLKHRPCPSSPYGWVLRRLLLSSVSSLDEGLFLSASDSLWHSLFYNSYQVHEPYPICRFLGKLTVSYFSLWRFDSSFRLG